MDTAENNVTELPARAHPPASRSVTVFMAEKYGMDPDAFELTVRETCSPTGRDARALSKPEFAAFLLVAKEYGLNPLTKEIYAFPNKSGGIVPVVSVDGWINLINSHPQCDGWDFEETHADGKLISTTCKMFRKDRSRPVVVTEYLDECWRDTGPWKMKHRMLRHKALIQAGRYAFGFAGIFDEDEAERIVMRDVTPSETVNTDPEKVTRASARPGPPPAAVIEHKPAATVEIIEPAKESVTIEAKAETGFPQGIVPDGDTGLMRVEPSAPATAKRRPGPPPGARTVVSSGPAMTAQQAVADVQAAFPGAQHVETRPAPVEKQIVPPSPEELRKRFVAAAKAAPDMDALNEAYEQIVGPHEDGMFPPDREDLLGIFTRRERELEV
jgi:phage recombination protein Bet